MGENLKRLMITLFEMVVLFAIYITSEIYIPLSSLREDSLYESSFWWVIFYTPICISVARSKYYSAWKLSMCAVHAAGVSYSGKDFERINTCNPVAIESTIHVRDKINWWNIGVQEWLRKSIYQRSTIKSKGLNQLYVFSMSAFWHGFYAAYYLSFTFWFLQLYVQGLIFKYCKNGRSVFVKIYKSAGIFGKIFIFFAVHWLFSSVAAPFLILRGYYCFQYLWKVKCAPQLILIVLWIMFTVMRPPRDPKPKQDKEEKTPLVDKKEEAKK